MNYEELKKQTNTGWNTWYSPSMTTHVLLPYGFAVNLCFRDYAEGQMTRNLRVGTKACRPGERSWDGKYTCLTFETASALYTVESTADGDDQYLLVTPTVRGRRAPSLVIEACLLWGKEGTLFQHGDRIGADFPDGRHIELYSTGKADGFNYTASFSPFVSVELDEPVAVATCPCTLNEVRAKLDEAKRAVLADEERYGVNSTAYQAMKSCLAWNTIYDPEHDRICSPVSREWNESWGGYVLFCWDTYFAALMGSYGSRELSYLNAFAITSEMTESGFVPNFGTVDNIKSRDRSQPPVGSMAVKLLYDKFGDDWVVRELWEPLYRWNTWYYENRLLPDGTLCWGSNAFEPLADRYFEVHNVSDLQAAKYESGLDNSPMYDDAVFDKETEKMLLSDVGLTGLYIKDCRSLIELAPVAGHPEAIEVLSERLEKTEAAMSTLWNHGTGIYENRDAVTGKLSHRISPTNLYSLYSRGVTDEQKKSMSEKYLLNPDELGGRYMLPSISRSDPAYPDQSYWRGRIWGPMNFLVYEALCDAGMEKEKQALADSSRSLLLKEWNECGHVHENYNGDDGRGCDKKNSDNFYHWGGLLAFIPLEYEAGKN